MKYSSQEKGFTLIELLVVIAIIALLSSVVLTSLGSARKGARDSRRVSDIRSVMTALELYYQDNGNYPCSSGELSTGANFLNPLVSGDYLSNYPKDPTNIGSYVYYYATYKNIPTGSCGSIYQLNYNRETSGTVCLAGGRFVPISDPTSSHCHLFVPTPLPCSDPYLENEISPSPDCQALQD